MKMTCSLRVVACLAALMFPGFLSFPALPRKQLWQVWLSCRHLRVQHEAGLSYWRHLLLCVPRRLDTLLLHVLLRRRSRRRARLQCTVRPLIIVAAGHIFTPE